MTECDSPSTRRIPDGGRGSGPDLARQRWAPASWLRRLGADDPRLVGAVLAIDGIFALAYWFLGPAEDAAILFRYSDHLHETGRIVYNLGGPLTEGATDFLWMVLLSGGRWFGLDAFASALFLSALSMIATGLCLAHVSGARRGTTLAIWTVAAVALPGLPAAVTGFSVFFFGFWCALMTVAAWEGRSRLLLCAALIACLTRPDGVVFAFPAIVWHALARPGERRRFVRDAVLLYFLPGSAYFLWRWSYFGEFLPLPFYVKSQFERTWGLFHMKSLLLQAAVLLALLPVVVVARPTNGTTRHVRLFATVLLLVPSLFYAMMTLSQNVGHRFQFPLLVIGAVLWSTRQVRHTPCTSASVPRSAHAPLTPAPRTSLRLPILDWRRVAPLLSVALLAPLWLADLVHLIDAQRSTRPSVAQGLAGLEPGKMAVAMAGTLPYYSRWDAVDLWGLNTAPLTRRLADPAWIGAYGPDLIVIHNDRYAAMAGGATVGVGRDWDQMRINAILAARSGGYDGTFVPTLAPGGGGSGSWHGELLTWGRAALREARTRVASGFGPRRSPSHEPRHDLYFVSPDYPDRHRLRVLLELHGGIDERTYRARITAVDG